MKHAVLMLLLLCGAAVAKPFAPSAFSVTVTGPGGKGPAIILIPGLGCPGSVWAETVAHFPNAQVHVLDLAGFAGNAPIDKPLSATVRAELAAYIRDRKLDHPIVIGHSLGGFIAYWLAASDPELVGPTIAIDAFPALGYDKDSIPGVASLAAQWKKMDAGAFNDQATNMFLAMATDPKRIGPTIAAVLRSDRRTFADAFVELFQIDLRPQLPRITARVLVVLADGPYQDLITRQVAGIAHRQVVIVPRARHFVMFDDPLTWFRVLDAFLKG